MPMLMPGPWYVASDLRGEEAVCNGLVVLARSGGEEWIVADCRNDMFPVARQRANARAVAAVPALVAALTVAERIIGDMRGNRQARDAHRVVVAALEAAGRPPSQADEDA